MQLQWRHGIAIILLTMIGIGISWYREERKCKERGRVYDTRLQDLYEAAARLPAGSSKQQVVDYFAKFGLPVRFDDDWKGEHIAYAHLEVEACSPGWYCGNTAALDVAVKMDREWRSISAKASGGFTNCL